MNSQSVYGLSNLDGVGTNPRRRMRWPVRVYVDTISLGRPRAWLERALAEISVGHTKIAVVLLPARTGAPWFHEYVLGGAQRVYFVRDNDLPKYEKRKGQRALAVFAADPGYPDLICASWAIRGRA